MNRNIPSKNFSLHEMQGKIFDSKMMIKDPNFYYAR